MLEKLKIRRFLILSAVVYCAAAVFAVHWARGARILMRPASIGPLGSISGRVTLDNGAPAVGYTVFAYPAALPFLAYAKGSPNMAVTDSEGLYTIALRPNPITVYLGPVIRKAKGYTVTVMGTGQSYIKPPDQNADPAALPSHRVAGIDFVLRLGPEVTVHVTDAITGDPIAGVNIDYANLIGMRQPADITDAHGTLRFRVPETHFVVDAKLPDHSANAVEFGPDSGSGSQTSREFKAKPGEEIAWNLKTYSTQKMSNWHGVVLGVDGKPVGAGVQVAILRASFAGNCTAVTDSHGRFTVQSWRMDGNEAGIHPYYGPPVAFVQQGEFVAAHAVTPDESWDGITLRLAPGASISGTLVDPQGKPAAHVNVTLSEQILSAHPWPYPAPTTVSDAQGHFKLSHLPPGEYQISFSGGGYGNLAVPPAAKPGVSQITLPLSGAQHVDMGRTILQLANQVLSGIVTDDKGKIVEGAYITVTGDHVHKVAISQGDGTFHVFDLEAEPLTMTVGVSQDVVTKKIAVGQTSIKVVLPASIAEAVARDRNPFHAPAPPASPVGPPKLQPAVGTALLDGLALAVHPGAGSSDATAAIYRPNWLRASMFPPPFLGSTFGNSIPMVWHGTLADLDGVKLTVKDNHGILVDRAGRKLWSGVVVDPPDYTIVYDETSPGKFLVDLRDAKGKTLWSGPGKRGCATKISALSTLSIKLFGSAAWAMHAFPKHVPIPAHASANSRRLWTASSQCTYLTPSRLSNRARVKYF